MVSGHNPLQIKTVALRFGGSGSFRTYLHPHPHQSNMNRVGNTPLKV